MPTANQLQPRHTVLPSKLQSLFWDHDFESLDLGRDQDFIVGRILAHGSWDAVEWLRAHFGDITIRKWIEAKQGRGLTPQQLRFWELIADVPRELVDEILADPTRKLWDQRAGR